MRWLFWLIALFALAAAVSLGARLNDGYVLLVFPPWRVEISFNLFLLGLAAALFVGYGIVRGLAAMLSLPEQARDYRERRQREKSFKTIHDALLLMQEGRFGQAMKKAREAYQTRVAPGLAALIAARAAQRLREPEKQREWIDLAKQADPQCEAAALMLEAEMGNDQRHYADTLQVLQNLQDKYGRHIAALRLELRACQGLNDWNGVLRLARQLEKRSAMPPEVAHEIRLAAHLENVSRRAGDQTALLNYLRDLRTQERDARLAHAVARQLHALAEDESAAQVIESQLAETQDDHWHEDLIVLYGQLSHCDLTARIAKAENWLRGRPRDAQLLLALGRLCRQWRLWGKAQSYLEASLAVGATAMAHLELARLFDQLERPDEANRHFRQSAELA